MNCYKFQIIIRFFDIDSNNLVVVFVGGIKKQRGASENLWIEVVVS